MGNRSSQLLGYPSDARLLIVNADDLGLCHAVNEAVFRALEAGVVRSATLMVPCPGAAEAMRRLGESREVAFGIHLTAVCDAGTQRWGPVTSRETVPSLVDESGCFYSLERIPELLARARLGELETEFRAQIEAVLTAGLKPTHLDWHCLHNGGRADVFEMTLRLAKEYGLAVRVAGEPLTERLQSRGLPTNDHDVLDSFRLDPAEKPAAYARLLRELPAGMSEWAVHPGLDAPDLRAMQPDGVRVRQTDFEYLVSEEARAVIEQEGIVLLDYRPLQALWRRI